MEIKIQNKDIFFLIMAIVGFIAFFIPWAGSDFMGIYSGYDLFINGLEMEKNEAWYLILLPVAFFLICLAKLGVIIRTEPVLIKIIEVIPLALIIIFLSAVLDEYGEVIEFLGEERLKQILKIIKPGVILTLIASVLVVFAPIKKRELASNSKKE